MSLEPAPEDEVLLVASAVVESVPVTVDVVSDDGWEDPWLVVLAGPLVPLGPTPAVGPEPPLGPVEVPLGPLGETDDVVVPTVPVEVGVALVALLDELVLESVSVSVAGSV